MSKLAFICMAEYGLGRGRAAKMTLGSAVFGKVRGRSLSISFLAGGSGEGELQVNIDNLDPFFIRVENLVDGLLAVIDGGPAEPGEV